MYNKFPCIQSPKEIIEIPTALLSKIQNSNNRILSTLEMKWKKCHILIQFAHFYFLQIWTVYMMIFLWRFCYNRNFLLFCTFLDRILFLFNKISFCCGCCIFETLKICCRENECNTIEWCVIIADGQLHEKYEWETKLT